MADDYPWDNDIETAGDPAGRGDDLAAQTSGALGRRLGERGDWDKFEREARPSQNVEDRRAQPIDRYRWPAPDRQPMLPPQLNGGLPAQIFSGNNGAMARPQPFQEQGAPTPPWPPQWRPNRQQRFIPSQANRPAHQLGKPPLFPQLPDMWQVPGIYQGVGKQLTQWGGSPRARLLARELEHITHSYTQGLHGGQRLYARERYQQMTRAADALQSMLEAELTGYGAAYASYGGDPNQLHSQLMDRAVQNGDNEMQQALNLGPAQAERLQQWRQAKLDDLHRSNSARREQETALQARNPFMVNPIGPDGTPTARGKPPFDTRVSLGERVQLAGAMPTPDTEVQGDLPPQTENNPQRWGAPIRDPTVRPEPQEKRWPDFPAEPPDEEGYEEEPPEMNPLGQQAEKPRPIEPSIPDAPGRRGNVRQGEQRAEARPVRYAQADTGTATDAEPEESDATGQRGTSDQPVAQPPGARGAQQPPPAPSAQPAGAAGQRGPQQPGRPAGPSAQPQTPDESAAAAPSPAQEQANQEQRRRALIASSPELTKAEKDGYDVDLIDGMASQWAIGQQTTSGLSRSGIDTKTRAAILARGTEIRNRMIGNIVNNPNIKSGDREAVLREAEKISPQVAAEVRGVLEGSVIPRKDTPYWVYQLANKADAGITPLTFKSRADTLKAHTVGPMGVNRMKLGTARSHAQDLLNELEELKKPGPNGVSVFDLWAAEKLGTLSPALQGKLMPETSAKIGRLNRDISTLNSEYNAVMAYTGRGTLTEREKIDAQLDPANPQRSIADVQKMITLMEARNAELKQNFEIGWGGNYDQIMKNYDPTQAPGADPEDKTRSRSGLQLLEGSRQTQQQPRGGLNEGLPSGWSIQEH